MFFLLLQKVKLIEYFRDYFDRQDTHTINDDNDNNILAKNDSISAEWLVAVRCQRTKQATVFWLSDGSVQAEFGDGDVLLLPPDDHLDELPAPHAPAPAHTLLAPVDRVAYVRRVVARHKHRLK